MPSRRQHSYDHRLRRLVRHSGDPRVAAELDIPRSTAMGWLRAAERPVVSLDVVEMRDLELQAEVLKLRRRVRFLSAVVRLLVVQRNASAKHASRSDWNATSSRATLIAAVERGRKVLPLRSVLRILRISSSAYSEWTNPPPPCGLDPDSICPRSRPDRLTAQEVRTVRSIAMDERFRHVPTGRLAVLAQRMGRVYASPSTWYRLVRRREWNRLRHRRHPETPRVGVRAQAPDQIWHIDASVIRLVDGSKVWLHAVIDNFSRRILSWRVAERFEIASSVMVLTEAVRGAVTADGPPQLVADGGVENFNHAVDGLVEEGLLTRVRALVDVRYSNSMIESFWKGMKHQWLFQHRLETAAAVRRHVEFYVAEYNATIPHSAFQGQTPDEIYFSKGEGVPRARPGPTTGTTPPWTCRAAGARF